MVPPTRVERRPEPGHGSAPPEEVRPARPAWLIPVAVAGVVAVVAVAGIGILGTPSGAPDDVAAAEEVAPPDPAVEGGGASEGAADADTGATETGPEDLDTDGPGAPSDASGSNADGAGPGERDVPEDVPQPPEAVVLDATEVADEFDRLRSGFLSGEVPIQDFRAGALDLYETPRLPDSLRARVAFGVYAVEALADPGEACRWIRRASDHAPGNERYRALAADCGN